MLLLVCRRVRAKSVAAVAAAVIQYVTCDFDRFLRKTLVEHSLSFALVKAVCKGCLASARNLQLVSREEEMPKRGLAR